MHSGLVTSLRLQPRKRHPALLLLLGLVLWSVTGCGFQLRGTVEFPAHLQPLQVTGLEVHDPLRRELLTLLRAHGVQLTDHADQARVRLQMQSLKEHRRVLSVGRDARVSEYEITTVLTYAVSPLPTVQRVRTEQLSVSREYAHDPAGVLGQSEQERLLREDMQRDMLRLLLYRLQQQADFHQP
ncbi:LPS assembly lipoprotein LptE [Thiorhodospira sibirica]|uniref:LPS-assembly lipoprotein LptE n=1 Tax=Thiorhodospira sibirica TaxID=154347 RepID=UPI00022C2306|nr:LPS assembly lipoprotein LptE [Thiorhodospira sibirica]